MNATVPGDDTCPRCGKRFHCGANDAAPCPCTAVRLDAGTLAALSARWPGCLCLGCLAALAQGAPLSPGSPPQAPPAA